MQNIGKKKKEVQKLCGGNNLDGAGRAAKMFKEERGGPDQIP